MNIAEFAYVLRDYPIVFTNTKPAMAVAVLGSATDENLFVDDKGTWMEGAYIPAYIRRYPFILSSDPSKTQWALCIDEVDGVLAEKGGGSLSSRRANPRRLRATHWLFAISTAR